MLGNAQTNTLVSGIIASSTPLSFSYADRDHLAIAVLTVISQSMLCPKQGKMLMIADAGRVQSWLLA
jgi:hypothetical protein